MATPRKVEWLKKPRGLVLASLGLVALIVTLTIAVVSPRSRPTVDLDQKGSAQEPPEAAFARTAPPLRVAVAAMISPKTTEQAYTDLLNLVGQKVGRPVSFVQRKTYAEVNRMLQDREVDLAFVCSGPYVSGHAAFGMELLVVPVAYGGTIYHCYILAHHDSPIQSLEGFRGKVFAFTDPASNTGCLVPRYMLAMQGETPESFFKNFFYTYSHDNSIRAVADGLADGAAVDHLIWKYMESVDPGLAAKTKVVATSPPFGIPPIVVHPDLDPALKQRLREVFLAMHTDSAAAPILRQLRIDKFQEADDRLYDSVREMQAWSDGRQQASK